MAGAAYYDVFIAYSSADFSNARQLAKKLEDDGLRVFWGPQVDTDQNAQLKQFDEALQTSATLVLLMSSNAFGNEWYLLEHQTAPFREASDNIQRFIPVLIANCTTPSSLTHFAHVDWRARDETEYQRLRDACTRNSRSLNVQRAAMTVLPPKAFYSIENPRTLALSHNAAVLACSDGYTHARVLYTGDLDGRSSIRLSGHQHFVSSIRLMPDCNMAVSGSFDGKLRIWDIRNRRATKVLKITPTKLPVVALSLSEAGDIVAIRTQEVTSHAFRTGDYTGYEDEVSNESLFDDETIETVSDVSSLGDEAEDQNGGTSITILRLGDQVVLGMIDLHRSTGSTLTLSPDASLVAFAIDRNLIQVWNSNGEQKIVEMRGHAHTITGICFTTSNSRLVSCSSDMTLRVWDLPTGKCLTVLEGHTAPIVDVIRCGKDGVVYSCDQEGGVRIWDPHTFKPLNAFRIGQEEFETVISFAVSGDGKSVAVGTMESGISVVAIPLPQIDLDDAVYSNAKVLLVGDSGTGKTGLAIRLTEGRFEATISSDAHWATKMRVGTFATHRPLNADTGLPTETDSSDREIWLWDFAGQADYRLIHQLFMDETSLAVLVFNPQSDQAFESIIQWMRDLTRACRCPFNTVLVAGRVDRGRLMSDEAAMREFVARHKFVGYIETSALTGSGCDELRKAIVAGIDWDRIPWTVSPRIFKLLKDEILRLRDGGVVLLNLSELQQQLEMKLPSEHFTSDDTAAVVGLLAGPGLVIRLEFGNIIVLQPEWINRYAAAVIRSIRSDIGGIGAIDEARVLAGDLDFTADLVARVDEQNESRALQMIRLEPADETIVLRARHQMFVDHGLCVRAEVDGGGRQLIFPSYFKNELPSESAHPPILVSYQFNGNASEIYSTLVVRLCHTKTFERDCFWKNAADFKSPTGRRVGLKITRDEIGRAAINVYFDPVVQDDTKVTFIKYVHDHLLRNATDVVRLRTYICPFCGHVVRDSELARDTLRESGEKAEIRCQQRRCDKWIPLWDLIEQKFASDETQYIVRQMRIDAELSIDNESRELILEGHARVITGEAGQIYRGYTGADHGIDGEIEFKDERGNASGKRLYLQLKCGDSYLRQRKMDGAEIFTIRKPRWATYWRSQEYPVMLVIRSSNGEISRAIASKPSTL